MTKWICTDPKARPTGSEVLELYCIPQAGMGAWAFHSWTGKLGPEISILPVELPGRNTRLGEPKHTDMSCLIDDLLTALLPLLENAKPYAIFGHSMGAWIGYELVRQIEARGLRPPVRLYVSANRAPQLAGPENDVDPTMMSALSYDEFWECFERRYGPSKDLRSDSVRRFVWPLLRADFELIERYRASPPVAVRTGIRAFGARGDRRYTAEQLERWSECTTGGFRVSWLGGGHNYVTEDPGPLAEVLRADLEDCVRRARSAAAGAP
uniref:Thioesterase n=1 Tax=Tetraselmis sp. GSL018 TaxID=582737 RepID=A0A061R8Y6_9CHLO|mmetsp:Transcript_13258/g.31387  ORF Transcript_13258/g.31387 Transcript_13258/m.31387 type:complete len:267 (-) Transcript_13258:209-1009(-)